MTVPEPNALFIKILDSYIHIDQLSDVSIADIYKKVRIVFVPSGKVNLILYMNVRCLHCKLICMIWQSAAKVRLWDFRLIKMGRKFNHIITDYRKNILLEQQIARHFVQYSECLSSRRSLLYNSKNYPFLNLMISINHDKGQGFYPIV